MRLFSLHALAAGILGCVIAVPGVVAQSFPGKPIRIVVPSSAGGGADTTARLLAQKLSDSVVAKLSQGVMQILRTKEVQARLTGDGGDPVGNTPEEYGVFLKAEVEKYAKLVKEIGLRID